MRNERRDALSVLARIRCRFGDVGLRVQLYVGKLLFMMRGVSAILYLVPSVTM